MTKPPKIFYVLIMKRFFLLHFIVLTVSCTQRRVMICEGENESINVSQDVDGSGRHGIAIHLAARYGHAEIVNYFLEESNKDINVPDDDGKTLLYWAARNGHCQVVDLLLAAGAQILDKGAQINVRLLNPCFAYIINCVYTLKC